MVHEHFRPFSFASPIFTEFALYFILFLLISYRGNTICFTTIDSYIYAHNFLLN